MRLLRSAELSSRSGLGVTASPAGSSRHPGEIGAVVTPTSQRLERTSPGETHTLRGQEHVHLVTVIGGLSKDLSWNEPVVLKLPEDLLETQLCPAQPSAFGAWRTKPELRITDINYS